jgi:hypothetical protein
MTRLLNGHKANSLDRSKVLNTMQPWTLSRRSFIQTAAGAAGLGLASPGVGTTARQYVPAANEQWRHRLPGIFTITDGYIRTADIGGPGLGIRDEMVRRPVGT